MGVVTQKLEEVSFEKFVPFIQTANDKRPSILMTGEGVGADRSPIMTDPS